MIDHQRILLTEQKTDRSKGNNVCEHYLEVDKYQLLSINFSCLIHICVKLIRIISIILKDALGENAIQQDSHDMLTKWLRTIHIFYQNVLAESIKVK